MSAWLKLVNDIKRHNINDYLTPTQKNIRDWLAKIMNTPEWVNLYGEAGAGKTFLGWSIRLATGATYVPIPELLNNLEISPNGLIIDNAPYQESEVRRILATCGLLKASAVLLITRTPITMPMRRTELPYPDADEMEMIIRHIGQLGYFCIREKIPPNPSIWDILLACV